MARNLFTLFPRALNFFMDFRVASCCCVHLIATT